MRGPRTKKRGRGLGVGRTPEQNVWWTIDLFFYLIYDVQTDRAAALVNVGMKNAIHKSDGGWFEGIIVGEEHPDAPHAVLVWCVFGAVELDGEVIESAENVHLQLGLDQFDDIRVQASFSSTGRGHLCSFMFPAIETHSYQLLDWLIDLIDCMQKRTNTQ